MAKFVVILSCLALISAIQGNEAVQYTVTDKAAKTPGGARFARDIGVRYTLQAMNTSTTFIWRIFRQKSAADRKNLQKVSLFIENMDGVAYATGNQIHVSAGYIQFYVASVKNEFTGVLYYGMARVWQWDGNGKAPGGLTQGIADYARLKAGYAPSHWVKPGQGDRWDEGYDVTARFLNYCNGLKSGFVANLNKKMRGGYSNNYFVELLGKTVDQLWVDYKAKYET
ncbi:uncharacterized protein LOC125216968 [Salvia hispanica]|uniref:uncharacterized protein LOC125216968 n=1 Tax=Salvia hispanica TaxID=49212 RepID=UPI002009195D|nr:uncharacterized protein LOC125216968 [Salvia hispanica]